MSKNKINGDDLRSVLGRMENRALVIPIFGHFLSNVRQLEIKTLLSNNRQKINSRCREDLKLFLEFFQKSGQILKMKTSKNQIVFWQWVTIHLQWDGLEEPILERMMNVI